MQTLTFHIENKKQLNALKAVAKVLEINFEVQKSPYNPAFVDSIKRAEKRGSYKTVDSNNLWESIQ